MLFRYKIIRGKRPSGDPRPKGHVQDTRKHTRHCLRPTAEMVEQFLASPTSRAWSAFKTRYLALLEARFREDPEPFRALADLARNEDVHLGCNCPTKKNPNVHHCHTVVALQFMKRKFSTLEVVLPK